MGPAIAAWNAVAQVVVRDGGLEAISARHQTISVEISSSWEEPRAGTVYITPGSGNLAVTWPSRRFTATNALDLSYNHPLLNKGNIYGTILHGRCPRIPRP